jgi:hypothetical protein
MKKKSAAKMSSCTSLTTQPSVCDIKIGMRISIASPRQMGKVDHHQPATLSASPTITVDGVPDKTVFMGVTSDPKYSFAFFGDFSAFRIKSAGRN